LAERGWAVVCWVLVSCPKVETVIGGTSYNLNLLNQTIISLSLKIGNKYFLENPISIKLMGLERGLIGLPHDKISDLVDLKLQRYNRFNIELL